MRHGTLLLLAALGCGACVHAWDDLESNVLDARCQRLCSARTSCLGPKASCVDDCLGDLSSCSSTADLSVLDACITALEACPAGAETALAGCLAALSCY